MFNIIIADTIYLPDPVTGLKWKGKWGEALSMLSLGGGSWRVVLAT